MFQERLKKEHPYVYQTLRNALKSDRLAHAYIFVGDKGAPKKETAYLLVQSLVCEGNDFACETCERCKRVEHNNFADMIYLDGSETSIKKEDIISLKNEFNKTNLESLGKKVYIIDGAEHATLSALNSILTFLEEPGSETIAILLVENIELLIETIKSRCQIITFQKMNKEECFEKVKNDYDILDAYLLSHIGMDIEKLQAMSESDEYQHATYLFKGYVDRLLNRDISSSVFLQSEGFTKGKRDNKIVLNYLLDMLNLIGKDVLMNRANEDTWYQNAMTKMSQYQGEYLLRVSNKMKDKNIKSANLNLLVDQFIYEMGDFNE